MLHPSCVYGGHMRVILHTQHPLLPPRTVHKSNLSSAQCNTHFPRPPTHPGNKGEELQSEGLLGTLFL